MQSDPREPCFSNLSGSSFSAFGNWIKFHLVILSYLLLLKQVHENRRLRKFDWRKCFFWRSRLFELLNLHHHEIHPFVKCSRKKLRILSRSTFDIYHKMWEEISPSIETGFPASVSSSCFFSFFVLFFIFFFPTFKRTQRCFAMFSCALQNQYTESGKADARIDAAGDEKASQLYRAVRGHSFPFPFAFVVIFCHSLTMKPEHHQKSKTAISRTKVMYSLH